MDFQKVIVAFLLFILGQTLTWFQVFGQIKWPSLMKNHIWIPLLTAIPITLIFMYATKYAKIGFDGEAWPIRMLTFSAGILVFAVFTNLILNQPFTLKTIVSLLLATSLMLIQIFWK